MRGGLSLYPLYVDPADATAADARETLYPVASEPAAGTQSFDPQRLATLIRSSTGRFSSTNETTDIDADVLNSLPKWAQAVPFLRDKLKRSSGQQSEIDYERPRKRRSFGTRDDSMEDEASELQNCLDELNDDPDEDSAMEDVEIKELPTLAEITADSVEKYVELLEKLIDFATERRQQENFEQEDMDVFHSKEVKVLRQILNVIEKNDWMNKLKPDLLIALMNEFDAQVRD
ncbi:Nipped-B-like protein [Phytophthora palmivora]|uniref:Nipped-B-like protein n=1 Tax=Phytophthora palmivora TaxID=4796 RepID=A0A2P4YK11_9STRA|nr:Nipped-B-like protein [Phytophthora palmivora]